MSKRHFVNYKIDMYTLDDKLLYSFNKKDDFEDLFKLKLNGAYHWLDVKDTIEVNIPDSFFLEEDIEDEYIEKLCDLGFKFYSEYWVSGCMGCLRFYREIENSCINGTEFNGFIFKFREEK